MIDATPFPVRAASCIPAVSARQMAEVDRLAVDQFGIRVGQMMELAGSHLAEVVRVELGGDLTGRRVVVTAGPGKNGGGGLVAARHLANGGASVLTVLAAPVNRLDEIARHQVATLLEMSTPCRVASYDVTGDEFARELADADAVVDAVLGYGAVGPPRAGVRWLVERIARAAVPVVSLDLPSGIDADGEAAGDAVTAAATVTLALPKRGLFSDRGRRGAGHVLLADIGLPAALYRLIGLDVGTPFALGPIVRLEVGA